MGRSISLIARISGSILLGVMVGLIISEFYARLDDKIKFDAPFWGAYEYESLFIYDSSGIHGKPNAHYLKWKLNEAGYRGPALRTGTYRIICMGSSETFGIFESEGKEWPRQLEQLLNDWLGDKTYEVVNTSYHAMSIPDQLRWLDSGLDALRPQVAVLYPGYTEYIDPTRVHGEADAGRNAADTKFRPRLVTKLRTIIKDKLPPVVADAMRKFDLSRRSDHVQVMDRVREVSVDHFEHDLNTLVSRIQARGVKVILITTATRFGGALRLEDVRPDDRRFLTVWRRFYPVLREEGFLDMDQRMSDAVRRVAKRRSVPLVDAAVHIQGAENFAEMVHFTDRGANALAKLVAQEIEQEPDTPRPRKELQSARSGGTKLMPIGAR